MGRGVSNAHEQSQSWLRQQLRGYSAFEAIRQRRSRRFGLGMSIESGPLTYKSAYEPLPLSEEEEAVLVFAASGITGFALADLAYGAGEGGSMLAGLVGRTVPSPDAINTFALFVINDQATYFIRRPQNLTAEKIADLIERAQLAQDLGQLVDIYRMMRVKLRDGRAEAPLRPGTNFNINKWSLYARGSTYFLPVGDLSGALINVLIESFDPEMGLFLLDERNGFRPAGIAKYGKPFGGHLSTDPRSGRVLPYVSVETGMAEALAAEQGMLLQNIGLMVQSLGLGGFVNFARSEFEWFDALGFTQRRMPMMAYGGVPRWMVALSKLMLGNFEARYPVGLEHEGETLLRSYSPPYFASMTEAVYTWVEHKFGRDGVYQSPDQNAWRTSNDVLRQIERPHPKAVEAAAALCEYLFRRYGRFPVYRAPFVTLLGFQAMHVDVEFYDRFYRPGALSDTQREHRRDV